MTLSLSRPCADLRDLAQRPCGSNLKPLPIREVSFETALSVEVTD